LEANTIFESSGDQRGHPPKVGVNGVASKHLTFHARFADFSRLIAVARKRRKSKIKK